MSAGVKAVNTIISFINNLDEYNQTFCQVRVISRIHDVPVGQGGGGKKGAMSERGGT